MYSHPSDQITPIDMEQLMNHLIKPQSDPAQKPESKPGPTMLQGQFNRGMITTSQANYYALIAERDTILRDLARSYDAREMERRLAVEIETELANIKADHFIARQLLDESTKVLTDQNQALKLTGLKLTSAIKRIGELDRENKALQAQNDQFMDGTFLPEGCRTCKDRELAAIARAEEAESKLEGHAQYLKQANEKTRFAFKRGDEYKAKVKELERQCTAWETTVGNLEAKLKEMGTKLLEARSCEDCWEDRRKATAERDESARTNQALRADVLRLEEELGKACEALDDVRKECEEQAERLENQATTIRTMRSSREFALAQDIAKRSREIGPGTHVFSVECVVPEPVTSKEDNIRQTIRDLFGSDFMKGMGG